MQLLILHLIEVWHRTPVMGNGTKSLLYNSMKVLVIIVLVCIWSCESGGGGEKKNCKQFSQITSRSIQ